jgi:hypothetical protein
MRCHCVSFTSFKILEFNGPVLTESPAYKYQNLYIWKCSGECGQNLVLPTTETVCVCVCVCERERERERESARVCVCICACACTHTYSTLLTVLVSVGSEFMCDLCYDWCLLVGVYLLIWLKVECHWWSAHFSSEAKIWFESTNLLWKELCSCVHLLVVWECLYILGFDLWACTIAQELYTLFYPCCSWYKIGHHENATCNWTKCSETEHQVHAQQEPVLGRIFSIHPKAGVLQ